MKKLLYLFSASLLVLTSCSSDDSNSSEPTPILLKKVSYVSIGESYTVDFTYSGNKIVSNVNNYGEKTTFTYTGDLITKIVDTDDKGNVDYTTEFTYTNGKLTSALSLEDGDEYKYKTKYVHNTDGSISFEEFKITVATGVEEEDGSGKYTYKDGNLVKKEKKSYNGYESSVTYEYDAKNHPFKNVLGFNLLLNDEESYLNNIVKTTISTDIYTNTYKYNAEGFPTEQKHFYNGALDETTTYTY